MAPPCRPAPRPPALSATGYAGLAFLFAFFAVYGSLVPFHYRPVPLEEALSRFEAVCQAPVRVESRSDWLANVLLFVPLGFLLTAALAVDRRRAPGAVAALAVVPICGALSAAVEFVQLYFPPRVTSLNDIVAESAGAALGALLWPLAGQSITDRCRRLWGRGGPRGAAAWLFPGYLAALLLVHLLPLDLTISPADLYHKYREGRVRLLPWGGPAGLAGLVSRDLPNFTYFLPFGLLLAGLPARGWRQPQGWPRVAALGLGLAGGVEALQLLVYSRSCDAGDVITGSLATLAGWGIGLSCVRPPSHAWNVVQGLGPSPTGRALALAGWLAVLVFVNWHPFDFSFGPELQERRLREFSLIPFADYFQGDYLNALDQFFQKAVFFVPVGALLLPARTVPARRDGAARVPAWAFLIAGVLETGQTFLPAHYPSVTDVFVGCMGAWFGLVMARQVRNVHSVALDWAPSARTGPSLHERTLTVGRWPGRLV